MALVINYPPKFFIESVTSPVKYLPTCPLITSKSELVISLTPGKTSERVILLLAPGDHELNYKVATYSTRVTTSIRYVSNALMPSNKRYIGFL